MNKVGWIDSHAHCCDEPLFSKIDDVIHLCTTNNITKVCLICMNFKELERGFMLKEKDNRFDIAFGFYPMDYYLCTDENFEKFKEVIKDDRIVAIGEIGLDYYWEKDVEKQKFQQKMFKYQLELAKSVNKPIIVHSRDAMKDTIELLKESKHRGVMHCYSGSVESMHEIVKLGYMISLAGPVTFKNGRIPRLVAEEVDLNHLLIETDSPYLTPEPYRGRENNPSLVSLVGKEIAKIKGIEEDVLQYHLRENYQRLFHSQ